MRREPPFLSDLAKFALFLDIDGTISDIAPAPELALVSQQTRDVLVRLHRNALGALAVISGRQLADIDRLIGIPRLPAAGIHGAELRRSDGVIERSGGDAIDIGAIDSSLRIRFAKHAGIVIERKPLAVAIHYRADPGCGPLVIDAARDIVNANPALKSLAGKMIVEILPATIDKGSAVARLMALAPFSGRIPVFAGDDTTDEDAFRVVNAADGISVKIGDGTSDANYGFQGAEDFRCWLAAVAAAS